MDSFSGNSQLYPRCLRTGLATALLAKAIVTAFLPVHSGQSKIIATKFRFRCATNQLVRSIVLATLLILLAGCGERELITDLSSRDRVELVAYLQASGVNVEDQAIKRGSEVRYSLTVPSGHYPKAIAELQKLGFPRQQAVEREGILPLHPELAEAKLNAMLEQKISGAIELFPGVVAARALVQSSQLSRIPRKPEVQINILHSEADLTKLRQHVEDVVLNTVPNVTSDGIKLAFLQGPTRSQEARAFQWPLSFRVNPADISVARTEVATLVLVFSVCSLVIGVWFGSKLKRGRIK